MRTWLDPGWLTEKHFLTFEFSIPRGFAHQATFVPLGSFLKCPLLPPMLDPQMCPCQPTVLSARLSSIVRARQRGPRPLLQPHALAMHILRLHHLETLLERHLFLHLCLLPALLLHSPPAMCQTVLIPAAWVLAADCRRPIRRDPKAPLDIHGFKGRRMVREGPLLL